MKKLVLTSLLAAFAVSGANAETNYFVGGSAGLSFGDEHATLLSVAPEFGWKVNSKWDLGIMGEYAYDRKHVDVDAVEGTRIVDDAEMYGIGAFARYNVAQFGGLNLLLKGAVEAEFMHFNGETASTIGASVIPMVTYDLTESFTLYANLNFLGVYAGYTWANEKMGIEDGWGVGAFVDANNVMNTSDFQIGFTYNF